LKFYREESQGRAKGDGVLGVGMPRPSCLFLNEGLSFWMRKKGGIGERERGTLGRKKLTWKCTLLIEAGVTLTQYGKGWRDAEPQRGINGSGRKQRQDASLTQSSGRALLYPHPERYRPPCKEASGSCLDEKVKRRICKH